jgi:hypothetical protein
MARTIVLSLKANQNRQVRTVLRYDDHEIDGGDPTSDVAEAFDRISEHRRSLESGGRITLALGHAMDWGEALGKALPRRIARLLAGQLHRQPVVLTDLAIELESEPRWLHQLPWELLLLPDSGGFVALEEQVLLYRRSPNGQGFQPGGGPLRAQGLDPWAGSGPREPI